MVSKKLIVRLLCRAIITGQVFLSLLHTPLSVTSNSVPTHPNGEVIHTYVLLAFDYQVLDCYVQQLS